MNYVSNDLGYSWFTWISAFSALFAARFLLDLDLIGEYLSVYRKRLGLAYSRTSETLTRCGIPYQSSNAGLFIYVNLSQWVNCFSRDQGGSSELNLCQYLIEHGVCLNPGEVSEKSGHHTQGFGLDHMELTFDLAVCGL